MSEQIFQLLNDLDFLKKGKVNKKKIDCVDLDTLIDFSYYAHEATISHNFNKDNSIYTHVSSYSLSGDRIPCSFLECRLNSLNRLAQYATLYSDQIYIKNYFSDFRINDTANMNEDLFRQSFYHSVLLLNHIKPLIDSHIIILISPLSLCQCCLFGENYAYEGAKRLKRLKNDLIKEFSNAVSQELFIDSLNNFCVRFTGPEKYVAHESSISFTHDIPAEIKANKKVLNIITKGGTIKLNKTLRSRYKFHNNLVYDILDNILFELTSAKSLNSHYLTDREIHIESLKFISGDPEVDQRNQIINKHLTSFVPFIENVNIKDLIKLRKSEEEAFILFRNSLNKAISECKNIKTSFSETDARSVYYDLVAPSLAMIDQKIKTAKRSLIKSAYRKSIGLVGAISFGIYSGFLPNEFTQLATALGFANMIPEFLASMMEQSDREEKIRNEELFFLWKVRELSK